MTASRLWLTVYELHDGPGYGYPHELWWRDTTFLHAPDVGDRLFFLSTEEEPEGSADIEVGLRYWTIEGQLNLQLRPIVHLPNDEMEKRINGYIHAGLDSYYRSCPMPWRAQEDEYGLLQERLRFSGWRAYAELP